MNNKNRHFRGQMEDEEIMTFTRKHWAVLLPHVIPFVIFICGVSVGVLLLTTYKDIITLPSLQDSLFQLLILIAIGGSAYVIHRFFLHLINYFSNVVIITNLRIVEIKKTLFLRDTKESLDIKKIQDVQFRQEGLIKNLLKFGDLLITLGNSEVKTILIIPNPDFHFRLLNSLKNEAFIRQQRAINQTEIFPQQNSELPNGDMFPGSESSTQFVSQHDTLKSKE